MISSFSDSPKRFSKPANANTPSEVPSVSLDAPISCSRLLQATRAAAAQQRRRPTGPKNEILRSPLYTSSPNFDSTLGSQICESFYDWAPWRQRTKERRTPSLRCLLLLRRPNTHKDRSTVDILFKRGLCIAGTGWRRDITSGVRHVHEWADDAATNVDHSPNLWFQLLCRQCYAQCYGGHQFGNVSARYWLQLRVFDCTVGWSVGRRSGDQLWWNPHWWRNEMGNPA